MNLHQIASGVISAVNPMQPATLRLSQGYQTGTDGKRTPKYGPPTKLTAQVQDLTQKDLLHLEGLNIQGSQKVLYLNGLVTGAIRVTQQGGDLIVLDDGRTYLTTQTLEAWPDWCKVSVTLQTDT